MNKPLLFLRCPFNKKHVHYLYAIMGGTSVALILGFHVYSLMRFPEVFVDEAWAANRAWGSLQTGRAFGTLDSDFMTEFPGYWTYFPLLPVLAQATVLRFFAAPSLLAMRLLSMFWGLVLLGCVYCIAYKLSGRIYAFWSFIFVAFSVPFFYSAHLARVDIMAAAFGFMALALHFNNTQCKVWLSVLSGFCVGLAFECHPHAAIYVPVVGTLYLWESKLKVFRRRDFWGFVCGGGLGVLLYVALHIAPYPKTYSEFTRVFFLDTHTPPVFTFDPVIIFESFSDLIASIVRAVPSVFPAVIGFFGIVRDRNKTWTPMAISTCVLIVSFGLLVRNKATYYIILLSPMLDMLAAAWLNNQTLHLWKGRVTDYLRRALVGTWLFLMLFLMVIASRLNYYPDYLGTQANLADIIMPGERIIGSQTYWFGFFAHDYDSWEELVYHRRYSPESSLRDAFVYLRPDIVIVDKHFASFSDDLGKSLYSQYLRLPHAEFMQLLEEQARLVGEFDGGCYGWIRVYRLYWP